MKKMLIITIALTMLMFIVAGVFIHFMPDPIAIHFNAEGVADGFGSPLTYFITPAVSAFIACILIIGTAISSARGLKKDHLSLSYITVGTMILLNIINLCLCINAYINGQPDAHVRPDFMIRIMLVVVGIYQIFLSHWLTMISYQVSSAKKILTEEQYTSAMQFVKKLGMWVGGIVAVTALFVPLMPETIVVVSLFVIWSIVSVIKITKNFKKSSDSDQPSEQ